MSLGRFRHTRPGGRQSHPWCRQSRPRGRLNTREHARAHFSFAFALLDDCAVHAPHCAPEVRRHRPDRSGATGSRQPLPGSHARGGQSRATKAERENSCARTRAARDKRDECGLKGRWKGPMGRPFLCVVGVDLAVHGDVAAAGRGADGGNGGEGAMGVVGTVSTVGVGAGSTGVAKNLPTWAWRRAASGHQASPPFHEQSLSLSLSLCESFARISKCARGRKGPHVGDNRRQLRQQTRRSPNNGLAH